jgi:hypothetical protein
MKARIAEVMSRILSEKHDAKIKITFKEVSNEHSNENDGRIGIDNTNARTRNH